MALRDAGYRVVNCACSLGRPEQRERREAELREACRRAGFALRLPERPAAISAGDDLEAAREELAAEARRALAEERPEIVVSPAPSDRHHGHGAVAEAVGRALAARAGEGPAPRWWAWALWGPLPEPTLATRFDSGRLAEIVAALEAHAGELARNDYRRLVRARAEVSACLAGELLFGFGAGGDPVEYAELLTEVGREGGRWLLGRPRWLDPERPLAPLSGREADLGSA